MFSFYIQISSLSEKDWQAASEKLEINKNVKKICEVTLTPRPKELRPIFLGDLIKLSAV
jgi:hypothetical protein